MMDSSLRIVTREKEHSCLLTAISTMAIGFTARNRELEFTSIPMDSCILVSGTTTRKMALEGIIGQTDHGMKGSTSKVSSTAKDHSSLQMDRSHYSSTKENGKMENRTVKAIKLIKV